MGFFFSNIKNKGPDQNYMYLYINITNQFMSIIHRVNNEMLKLCLFTFKKKKTYVYLISTTN